MKSTNVLPIPPEKEPVDDTNHNHLSSENRNGFRHHIQGPPNLETILRANGKIDKKPFLSNGDLPPSLNCTKTPVIIVKTVSALNFGQPDEKAVQESLRRRDTAVAFPGQTVLDLHSQGKNYLVSFERSGTMGQA